MAQFDLFEDPDPDDPARWPDPTRFPHNAAGQAIGPQLLADLDADPEPLVITGYAALGQLIPWLAGRYRQPRLRAGRARLLLGNEPFPTEHRALFLDVRTFADDVREHWTKQGISLYLFGQVLAVLELLDRGGLQVRYPRTESRGIHAKIYVTDAAVTLGSSNFTRAGLHHQGEGDARFTQHAEPERHRETRRLAEAFWSQGRDCAADFRALLKELLQVINWKDALARACAELLEGTWAAEFHQPEYADEATLWPSQRQGIAQALWLLRSAGSVLIADATGSGKTRMGVHLLRTLTRWRWRSGRASIASPVLVCPPAVRDEWAKEQNQAAFSLRFLTFSDLSKSQPPDAELLSAAVEALRRTPVLAIDEGHNFINLRSQRTKTLLGHLADAVVIFTATPINRGPEDLLRIINLLGPDHWRDETLACFKKSIRRFQLNRPLTSEEQALLRQEIQRFTVRRTKTRFNQLIDESPEDYRNRRGQPCRYPQHQPHTYRLDEAAADIDLARHIHEQARRLKGLHRITQPLTMSEWEQKRLTEERVLRRRLHSVRALAQYDVADALRSSRAALFELLEGTAAAAAHYRIDCGKTNATGDLLGKLRDQAGRPPGSTLTIPVPEWLTDPAAHRRACEEEIACYQAIAVALRALSAGREAAKVARLLALRDQHALLIAFDSHLITLSALLQPLRQAGGDGRVWVATGQDPAQKRQVREALALGSRARGIALCSDSMSEGINLQQASAILHLDMPSVVRTAEQRVGRVDRMDSPHSRIEVWWPQDHPAFALRTDERLAGRLKLVEETLGSNVPLPEHLLGGDDAEARALRAEEVIQDYARQSVEAELDQSGIHDVFEPVRALVAGPSALIEAARYAQYRHVKTRGLTARVSLVPARQPWAFFCVLPPPHGVPRWVLFAAPDAGAELDLSPIGDALRERLQPDCANLPPDVRTDVWLKRFLDRLGTVEKALLPRLKQRALTEMEAVLNHHRRRLLRERTADGLVPRQMIERLLDYLKPHAATASEARQPDWGALADAWLTLIQPVRHQAYRRRSGLLTLRDLRDELCEAADLFTPDALRAAFEGLQYWPSLHERIVSCIVGVPEQDLGPAPAVTSDD